MEENHGQKVCKGHRDLLERYFRLWLILTFCIAQCLQYYFHVTVIARNPKSLSALSSGKASYGARSILDQAVDYVDCAKLYPCMYQTPKASADFLYLSRNWLDSKSHINSQFSDWELSEKFDALDTGHFECFTDSPLHSRTCCINRGTKH